MKPSVVLNRYLARVYGLYLLLVTGLLWGVIYLFDTVELLRRAGKHEGVPLSTVLQMGLLKLPDVGLTIFPFAILFSALFAFWQLNRRHELIVARAAGFSVWQILYPVMGVALVAGFVIVTVVNPISALMMGRFEVLENTVLAQRKSFASLSAEGLWLRQVEDDGYMILHAGTVGLPGWTLRDVMVIGFDREDGFLRRIDARQAALDDGRWRFTDVRINRPQAPVEALSAMELATDLTTAEIEESFASPETMSFWQLPMFIRLMEATGFDSTRLKIHFHTLMAQPFLFAAMVLLAAAVSLRPPRLRGTLMLVITGIMTGFFAFFMSSFLQALGASHQIPVVLAAWSPALILILLGTAAILNLEDG